MDNSNVLFNNVVAFQSVVDKAGIEKCNRHTLMHTFTTRCFERGIPIKIVSKWLGHSKVMYTLDIYTHVLPDIENNAIKVLEISMVQSVEANENVTRWNDFK